MIDAFVKSVGEPQLSRCLESVKTQAFPFTNIIHVDGISPEVEAFNTGIKQVKSEWVMFVDGDFILYNSATVIVKEYIENEKNPLVVEYQFGLYDGFLNMVINSCRVSKTEIIRKIRYKDWLSNDLAVVRTIEGMGYRCMRLWKLKPPVVIGTHFEDPDLFQIFLRHYHAGILRTRNTMKILNDLYRRTSDSRYDLAIKSMNYGLNKRYKEYPGSHNINYDRKIFEEFKRENNSYPTAE